MAKKLSDIDLRNRRKAEAAYNLSKDPSTTAGERENARQTSIYVECFLIFPAG